MNNDLLSLHWQSPLISVDVAQSGWQSLILSPSTMFSRHWYKSAVCLYHPGHRWHACVLIPPGLMEWDLTSLWGKYCFWPKPKKPHSLLSSYTLVESLEVKVHLQFLNEGEAFATNWSWFLRLTLQFVSFCFHFVLKHIHFRATVAFPTLMPTDFTGLINLLLDVPLAKHQIGGRQT